MVRTEKRLNVFKEVSYFIKILRGCGVHGLESNQATIFYESWGIFFFLVFYLFDFEILDR
jgi:hypothetical protein